MTAAGGMAGVVPFGCAAAATGSQAGDQVTWMSPVPPILKFSRRPIVGKDVVCERRYVLHQPVTISSPIGGSSRRNDARGCLRTASSWRMFNVS